MSIGERRMRVVFQTPSISQDAYGEADKTWSNLCTAWALVQPLKGAERLDAQRMLQDVEYRVVTRYQSALSGLDTGDRMTWDGLTFDIRAVIWRDHTRKELEILATVHK
jgi:SPP1 family predicted phage head-tail adaptor